MMSCRNRSAVSAVCLSSGKFERMPALFLAAERRIGHDDVHAVFVADFPEREAQGVAGINLGIFKTVEEQVHLAEEIGKRLGLNPVECSPLQARVVLRLLALLFQMFEGFDEESAGARGRIKDRLAELRVNDGHDELDHRARRVEFAGIARRVAHFAEHRLVESARGCGSRLSK